MKFWKILRKLLDEISPDWQDKFISYKDLKHQLKLICPSDRTLGNDERPNKRSRLTGETMEMEFLKLLGEEIKKINDFFIDKEEECMIKLKGLKAEVYGARESREELMKLGREVVNIHGEMILLKNYSALNCIGLLKILKKYDKRSGDVIRIAFIEKVLREPFLMTEIINNLVEECELMIHSIFSLHDEILAPTYPTNPREVTEEEQLLERVPNEVENEYVRLSRSALRTLKQIRNGSSTVNMFSLPPMD